MKNAFASGKIILSGEYAVVFGYRGIAIPSPLGITVSWEQSDQPLSINWNHLDAGLPTIAPSAEVGPEWRSYLDQIIQLCEKAAARSFGGSLKIDCDLPLQRGMGSSTALVIAVSRCLLGDDCETQAKEINDTVDVGNSGLDFAVIWQNRPLIFRKGEPPEAIDLPLDFLQQSVLIDTGKPNETTMELVAWIGERKDRDPGIADALALIGDCTEAMAAGEHPMTIFPDHHRAQLALGVVPDAVHQLIVEIEQAGGAAKVIGAGGRTGGGGMVLAIHPNAPQIQELAERHGMS